MTLRTGTNPLKTREKETEKTKKGHEEKILIIVLFLGFKTLSFSHKETTHNK